MRISFYLITLLSFFITSSCSVSLKKKNEQITLATDEYTEEDSVYEYINTAVYKPSRTLKTDLIHTKLEIEPIWESAELKGKATLTLKPHFYSTDSVFLDAKGMEIQNVTNGKTSLPYSYQNNILAIKLERVFSNDEKIQLEINYLAKPENQATNQHEAFGSNKGLYFINPKKTDPNIMPQIWTQGETENNSIWFPTIDAPNVKSTQEIYLTVDSKFVTLSNGKLISQKNLPNGKRTDYWKQDLPHAPYLFMFAVGEFKIVKDTYTKKNGQKIDVNYYVEPEWEQSAKAIFGETPAMIGHFSKLLGVEFPWDKYHQIVVRDYISGAMENTGAVVFGDFVYKNNRQLLDENNQSIIAHELFHHWFGDLVTCESWANLPLNESFANYAEYLWDEYKLGKDEADYNLDISTDQYFQEYDNGTNHNLIWYQYDKPDDMFDRHSYNKGGRILHMLRNYVGDEAFFASLNKYLTTNQFKSAEIDHLRLAFEEVTGEDLHWFFDQWFLNKGLPNLDINYDVNIEHQLVKIKINQLQSLSENPIYKLPLQFVWYDDAGEHKQKITIDKIENEFSLPLKGNLKTILFDDSRSFLGYYKENKTPDFYINQYYLHSTFLSRYEALMFATLDENEKAHTLILDALKDKHWFIRKTAIEKISYLSDEERHKIAQSIALLAKKDANSEVRATALQALFDFQRDEQFMNILKSTASEDSSYIVLKKALLLTVQLKPSEIDEMITTLQKNKDKQIILMLTSILTSTKNPTYLSYFLQLINQNSFKGYDALELLNNFTFYITSLPLEYQVKALEVYKKYQSEGNFYAKMYLPQNVYYLISSIESKEENDPSLSNLKEMYLKQLNEFYKTLNN
jgi:aminopeptidase N